MKTFSTLLTAALLAAAGFLAGWNARGTKPPPTTPAPAKDSAASLAVTTNRHERVATPPPDRIAAAVRVAHSAPDAASRLYQFALRLRELAPPDYPAVFAALRAMRTPESPELLSMLCSEWARHDGAAAFAAGRALAGSDGEYRAWHSAIAAWAQKDPTAAHATLRTIGATDLASDEMSALMAGWAANDPGAVEAFLGTNSATRATDDDRPAATVRGFEAIARARIDADPANAMAWYGALPESLKERLRQAVTAKLAAVDPSRATEWLARDSSAQLGSSDVQAVLRGMRLDGYEQQFAWANSLANPVTRESALAAVVQEGSASNLVSLGEWLGARCDNALLAPAFAAYAARVVQRSPLAAVAWASSLDDAALRKRTLEAVAMEWNGLDPRAARQWATQSGLVDWNVVVR